MPVPASARVDPGRGGVALPRRRVRGRPVSRHPALGLVDRSRPCDRAVAVVGLRVVLPAVGGLLYSAGGVVYGIKRPNPSPRWFGFHEVFHALTLLAFVTHYTAVSITTYSG